jgi:large subunit ribosomal protein L4
MIVGALRSALSAKLRDGELRIVEGFTLADHKTKNFQAKLSKLNAANTVLLVENAENRNLTLSSSNLPGVKLVASKDVTTYDLLKHKNVLLSKAAAEKLSEALK